MDDVAAYLQAQGAPVAASLAPQVSETRPISERDLDTVKKRLKDLFPNIGNGQGGQQLRDQAQALASAPVQYDLSPTMAAIDNAFGGQTNLAKSYKAPETPMDRTNAIAKLQEAANGADIKDAGALGDFLKSQLQTKVRTLTPKEASYGKPGAPGGVNTAKLAKAFGDDLDPNKARGGNLAKSQAVINSAERLDGLFSQFPDGNVPKAQTVELATATAGLISNGSPQSQHQINDLVPDSIKGKVEDIASWVTNNPRGREQQQFVQLLQHTAAREKEIATSQVRKAQIQRMATHGELKAADPKTYDAIRNAYGLSDDVIDSYTKPQAPVNGGGMITVSNGKETLQIHPDDLVHAKAEGYSETGK